MKIMFDDLTYEAQIRLLAEAGVESPRQMGWEIRPVATVDIEKQERHLEDNFLDNRHYRDYD